MAKHTYTDRRKNWGHAYSLPLSHQRRNQLCLGAGDQEGGKGPVEKRAYLRARKKRFRADSLVEERLIKGIRMIYW